MDIRVRRENHQILLRLNQVRMEIYRKKTSRRYLWSGLFAIGFLTLGTLQRGDFGSIWNPLFAFGIGTLFTIYLAVAQLIKLRKDVVVQTAQKIALFMRRRDILEISLTDAMVEYRQSDLLIQANWSNFSSYILYKDCLFVIFDEKTFTSLSIGKEELPAEAWHELLDFMGRKLPVLQKI